ncbi:MAG: ABC transporter ATP-binding protein [Promethearchaeota archaeon]
MRKGPMGRGPMGRGHMGAMMIGEKPHDLKGALKKLIKYLSKYRISIIIVFLFAILSTIANIIGPKILGKATTKLFEGIIAKLTHTGDVDFGYIGQIILITLLLYALSSFFGFLQGWIMAKISADVSYRFRRDINLKINRLPLKYFDKTTHGEVLSRITNDVDVINQSLSQSITQIISSIVTIVGIFIMMLSIDWRLTLITLGILPLSMIFITFIIKRSQQYFKGQQDYLGHINGHIEEMYSGHIVVKSFNGEQKSIEKFDSLNNKLYNSAWKAQFFSGLMMPITFFIGNLGYVFVVVMGGYLTYQKAISIGDLQAFIQYVRSFTQPINQIATISNTIQQTGAAAERIFKFLEEEEEIEDTTKPIKLEEIKGKVEFKHVRFGYEPNKIIIKDFSAVIKPGQKIAIVGPTGAGKTTLVKLLMRFYELNSGEIFIDNYNIKEFSKKDLRKIFGMVLQDTWLFNGTIMQNIRYGRPDATDEEVIEAAKIAHADHFIRTLPNSYNMVLNEEISNISTGQMQLITIARAILKNPKILILDEATSNVDTHTELLIQKAMDNLMKGRTSFVIAHRLSTIQNADLIIVINLGDIVEQGTHEELLRRNGFYAKLYYSQFDRISQISNSIKGNKIEKEVKS